MSTAFADLKTELGAMPLDMMRAEIGRRGYRLEEWNRCDWTTNDRPWFTALVFDDAVSDPESPWDYLVAHAFEQTERAALESVLEDIRIANWTVTFKEAAVQA